MYSDELFQIGSVISASATLICVLLIVFVVLLTYAKDKVTHPRLCFFGAVLFGMAFALPAFAMVLNGVVSNWFEGSGSYESSYGNLFVFISVFAAPLLLSLSLMFLIFSLKPEFNKKNQIGNTITGAVDPPKNPFE